MRADAIARALGGRRCGSGWVARCPAGGGMIDCEVKFLFGPYGSSEMGARALCFRAEGGVEITKGGEVGLAPAKRRLLGGEALDRDSHSRHVLKLSAHHQRHAHAAIGENFKRLVGGEPRHRLAHWHDRNPERLRDATQREFLARHKCAAHEQVAQFGIDVLTERDPLDAADARDRIWPFRALPRHWTRSSCWGSLTVITSQSK